MADQLLFIMFDSRDPHFHARVSSTGAPPPPHVFTLRLYIYLYTMIQNFLSGAGAASVFS